MLSARDSPASLQETGLAPQWLLARCLALPLLVCVKQRLPSKAEKQKGDSLQLLFDAANSQSPLLPSLGSALPQGLY